MNTELRDSPDAGDRLVTIADSLAEWEAHLCRTILEQFGIQAVVADQYVVWSNWFLSNAVGGVKVQVRLRDVPTALEVLSQPPGAFPLLEPDAEPPAEDAARLGQAISCPECGASTVSFRRFNVEGFLLRWLDKVLPLPALHGAWICGVCGKRWLEGTTPAG